MTRKERSGEGTDDHDRSDDFSTPVVSNIDPAVSDSELRPHLHVHSVTLTGLFILAVFFTLHLGRVIFLPITIALLFAVLFAPLLRRLNSYTFPSLWARPFCCR